MKNLNVSNLQVMELPPADSLKDFTHKDFT